MDTKHLLKKWKKNLQEAQEHDANSQCIQCMKDGIKALESTQKKKQRIEVKPLVNLLERNVCTLPDCRCGWNIKIGSRDYELLDKLDKWLEENTNLIEIGKSS